MSEIIVLLKGAFINVDYVFHAAALKQVPSCEFYPIEAVKTNVLGSDNVISACVKNGIKKSHIFYQLIKLLIR